MTEKAGTTTGDGIAMPKPMEEVMSDGLSFATHLIGSIEAVKRRSAQTQSEYGEVHRALKELAAVEEAYGKGLKRVAGMLQKISKRDVEFVGFADAMDAVRSNLNHGGDMHISLGYSVSSELAQPLATAKNEAQANAKSMTQRATAQHKQLKAAEEKRKKTAARAIQLAHDAATHNASAREALGGACQEESPALKSSQHWLQSKLSSALAVAAGTTSATATTGTTTSAAERSQGLRDQATQLALKANEMRTTAIEAADSSAAEARRTALEAQRVLCEFQRNEESCIAELRDSLRKLCVFVSSALSSRHYDLQSLARVLDDLEPSTEIERFIRRLINLQGPPPLTIDTTIILAPFAPASIFSTGETQSLTSSSASSSLSSVAAAALSPTPPVSTPLSAPPAHRLPDTIVRLPVLPPPDRTDLPVVPAADIFILLDQAAQRDANLITGVRVIDPVSGIAALPANKIPQDEKSASKDQSEPIPQEETEASQNNEEAPTAEAALPQKDDADKNIPTQPMTSPKEEPEAEDKGTVPHVSAASESPPLEAEEDIDDYDEDDTTTL